MDVLKDKVHGASFLYFLCLVMLSLWACCKLLFVCEALRDKITKQPCRKLKKGCYIRSAGNSAYLVIASIQNKTYFSLLLN